MNVSYLNNQYIIQSTYDERSIPKSAGCRWNPELKQWWTDKPAVAAKLKEYFNESATQAYSISEQEIQKSKKTDVDIVIPAPEGLQYLPFQKAGIAYAIERVATLIADEMGLGKTIQSIGIINADETIKRILIICPASLRLNWQREMQKWLVRELTIQIIEGKKTIEMTGDIIVINYDIVSAHRQSIDNIQWDLMISDEAHYLKNGKAQCTQSIVGKTDKKNPEKNILPIRARKRLFLTGTPIVNRPIELWTLASYLNPSVFNSFWSYARRYCGAVRGRYGWDMTGATNLDELQDTLRASCMVRRLKKDVLTELPPKRRQVIELPANGAISAVNAESRISTEWEGKLNDLQAHLELAETEDGDTSEIYEAIKNASKMAFTEMAKARHETALAKVPYCVEHIIEAVEANGQIVVFAHHHDVINNIQQRLTEKSITSVVLTGDNNMDQRQSAIDDFQAGTARVFIGSISAAGLGLTLTASSHVIFCELPWTPSELSQAEDRCHRIGQTENVLIQHIVLDGSIDQRMAQALIDKQEVIDKALDIMVRQKIQQCPVMPVREKRASNRMAEIERIAGIITDDQINFVHNAMKQLSGLDMDFATGKNNIGFSKIDTIIGHELSEKPSLSKKQAALAVIIVCKYHRQIDVGILDNLKKDK